MKPRARALKAPGDHGQSAAALAANAARRQALADAQARIAAIDAGRGQLTPAQVRTALADLALIVLTLVKGA